MKAFTFERASSPTEAAAAVERHPGARFIAGGTNLLDLMKLQIEVPAHLVKAGDTWTIDGLAASDKVTVMAAGYAPLELTVP